MNSRSPFRHRTVMVIEDEQTEEITGIPCDIQPFSPSATAQPQLLSTSQSGRGCTFDRSIQPAPLTSRRRMPQNCDPAFTFTQQNQPMASVWNELDWLTEEEMQWLCQDDLENTRPSHTGISPSTLSDRKSSMKPLRNGPLVPPCIALEAYEYKGINLRPRVNVELEDGDFMRIVEIIHNLSNSEVTLRGWIFRRAYLMNGMLEKKINEVCWILHVDEDDERDLEQQGMEDINVSSVLRRRVIRLTNQAFPALSWRDSKEKDSLEVILNQRVLVCRFKYICSYTSAKARALNIWSERALCRLRREESDHSCGVNDNVLRQAWRESTERGGSCYRMQTLERRHLSEEARLHKGQKPREVSRSSDPHNRTHNRHRSDENSVHPSVAGSSVSSPLEIDIFTVKPDAQCRQKSSIRLNTPAFLNGSETPTRNKHSGNRSVTHLHAQGPSSHIDLTCEDDLRSGTNQMSIKNSEAFGRSRKRREHSPDIIEIEMGVKSSFKPGAYEQQWEGRVVSNRSPVLDFWLHTGDSRGSTNNIFTSSTKRRCPASASSNSQLKRSLFRSRTTSSASSKATLSRDRSPSVVAFDEAPAIPSSGGPIQQAHGASADQHASRLLNSLPPDSTKRRSVAVAARDAQRYTFGDAFCGAGGTSRGAVMAGFRIEWGFDHDAAACMSYALNFPTSKVHQLEAHDFAAIKGSEHKVDVLHLSPPCQFFSDAHTVDGKNDEVNTASQFVISDLLKKTKPRVATMEQTSGLPRRHPHYLQAILQMFTAVGFSIRWRILNCSDFGLAQRRMRLFVIASCPGEPLPSFPKTTHAKKPQETGLKPHTTINQAIARIPSEWANHDISKVPRYDRLPEDGNKQVGCITTSGGGFIHPSGRRGYTLREFACLQGFPLEHVFGDVGVKRQIGNAVAPIVGKALLEHIKKALSDEDGAEGTLQ